MSWEDEDSDEGTAAVVDEPQTSMWDDEEDAPGDSELGDWDADPAPKKTEPEKKKPAVKKKLSRKQIIAQKEAKEKAERERIAANKRAWANKTSEQLEEEKAQQLKKQERDEDAQMAGLFGFEMPPESEDTNMQVSAADLAAIMPTTVAAAPEQALETKADYVKYGKKAAARVSERKNKFFALAAAKAFLQDLGGVLELEEVNALKSAINVLHQEKTKARSAANKKKKPAKGPSLRAGSATASYGDYDDFEF
jgi:HAMP domain-containing protein